VRVDKTRCERETMRVDHAIGRGGFHASDRRDAIADNANVDAPRGGAGAIEDERVADDRRARWLLRKYAADERDARDHARYVLQRTHHFDPPPLTHAAIVWYSGSSFDIQCFPPG